MNCGGKKITGKNESCGGGGNHMKRNEACKNKSAEINKFIVLDKKERNSHSTW